MGLYPRLSMDTSSVHLRCCGRACTGVRLSRCFGSFRPMPAVGLPGPAGTLGFVEGGVTFFWRTSPPGSGLGQPPPPQGPSAWPFALCGEGVGEKDGGPALGVSVHTPRARSEAWLEAQRPLRPAASPQKWEECTLEAPWNPRKCRLPSGCGAPGLVAQEARVSGRLPPECLLEQRALCHRPDRPQRQLQARTCLRAGQDLAFDLLTSPGLRPPLRQVGALGPSGDQATGLPVTPRAPRPRLAS